MSFRYLGNKARIADWITDVIVNILPKNANIGDPMCGTATISEAFARRGMKVVASDPEPVRRR